MKKQLLIISLLIVGGDRLSAQTILGIDVSGGAQGAINWQQVYAAGKVFAWAKATEGVTFNDAQFSNNMINGSNAGVVMGAYHFARPDNNTAVNEATHFLNIAGSYIGAGHLPPALDIEDPYAAALSISALSTWIQQWMTTVQNQTGIAPILYTTGYYASHLNSSLNVYKIWIASPDGSPTTPPNTGVWPTWAFKQYSWTGTVSGINTAVDLDVFNGNTTAFNTLIGASPPSNDNCSAATLLTSSASCNYLNNQTVNNATASGKPKGTCDAYTGTPALADVWYYFQAQSTSCTITVDPNGSALDAVIVAYNSCTNNAEIGCSDTPGGNGALSTLSLTGLTCGNYYYIRVYDYGLQTTNGGFRICVAQSGNCGGTPDLIISAGTQSASPATVAAGANITAYASEDNIGTATAGPNQVTLWLSSDATLNTCNDIYIGAISGYPSLSPNSNSTILNSSIQIPCNTPAGTYNLFFWADGCSSVCCNSSNGVVIESNENNNYASTLITVTPSSLTPAVSIAITSGSNPTCSGASVTFTAYPTNGGASPAYQWKKNGSPIAGATSSTYTTSTLANGDVITCTMTSSLSCASPATVTSAGITITITSSLAPSVSIAVTSGSNPTCSGASITFSANPVNGGASPGYQWKKNGGPITGANSSTYSTSALANGDVITCTMTSGLSCVSPATATSLPITVTVTPSVIPSVTISQTSCSGNSVSFTSNIVNGGSNPSYLWTFNGAGSSTNSTGPDFTLNNTTNGTQVQCTITSNTTCANPNQVTSSTLTINCIATAIPSIDGLEEFKVVPNPNAGVFAVKIKLNTVKDVRFRLLNVLGQTVYESGTYHLSGTQSKEINVSKLLDGVYFLETKIDKDTFIEKVVINKN